MHIAWRKPNVSPRLRVRMTVDCAGAALPGKLHDFCAFRVPHLEVDLRLPLPTGFGHKVDGVDYKTHFVGVHVGIREHKSSLFKVALKEMTVCRRENCLRNLNDVHADSSPRRQRLMPRTKTRRLSPPSGVAAGRQA